MKDDANEKERDFALDSFGECVVSTRNMLSHSKANYEPTRSESPEARVAFLPMEEKDTKGKVPLTEYFSFRALTPSTTVTLDPSHLHLNQPLTFTLSVDFHPAPFEPTLQCAQCQIMLLTKCAPPQPTGFEFPHQSLDLLAASPLPNANLSDFRHADSASKTRPAR